MTDATTSVSLELTKVLIGGYATCGLDARALHRALSLTAEFGDWIIVQIASDNYQENQDFIARRSPLDERVLDYVFSLDMAKEVTISQPPSPKRNQVRRFLIDAERKTIFATVSEYRPTFDRPIEEISVVTIKDIVKAELRLVVAELIEDRRLQSRYGKTAGQIWRDKGFPSLRLDSWFSNKLLRAGCAVDGAAFGELGHMRRRLFDPDKADRWLAAGGIHTVKMKIAERQGQSSFKFEFSRRGAA